MRLHTSAGVWQADAPIYGRPRLQARLSALASEDRLQIQIGCDILPIAKDGQTILKFSEDYALMLRRRGGRTAAFRR